MKRQSVILSNAAIWAIVMIACAVALKESKAFPEIQLILGAGAVISLFVVARAGIQAP